MTVQQSLAAAIAEWLKAKPSRSLNMLTRLASGVSYSSVRRALQGDIDQAQSTVISIASVVMSDEQLRLFLRTYYPTLERAVADVRAHDPKRDEVASDSAPDEAIIIDFLKSPEHSKILILASARTGTNDEEVSRKWGENHLTAFGEMKASGILRNEGDSWYFDSTVGNVSLALARKVLASLMAGFDSRADSVNFASYSYLRWESLNEKGVKKAYEANARHAEEIHGIFKDPENLGDKLLIFGMIHNILKGWEDLP